MCPPLFGFASSDDADRLDSIADEVLGPEDDAPAVRSGAACLLALPAHISLQHFKHLLLVQYHIDMRPQRALV